jgi:hypothetical protein
MEQLVTWLQSIYQFFVLLIGSKRYGVTGSSVLPLGQEYCMKAGFV